MDWFNQLGNMTALFPDAPALAWDMALNGPDADYFGYGLAYDLQTSPTQFNVYPVEETAFPETGV